MKTIDYKFFPHIFDSIFEFATFDAAALLKLRLTSFAICERVDAELWRYARMTDDGLRDARGLALEHIPPSSEMRGKYLLDVDVSEPVPDLYCFRPGIIRLLRYPRAVRILPQVAPPSPESDSEDSEPGTPETVSEYEPESLDSEDPSRQDDRKPDPQEEDEEEDRFRQTPAGEACVFFDSCAELMKNYTAPSMCLTVDLENIGKDVCPGLGVILAYEHRPDFYLLLQLGTGTDLKPSPEASLHLQGLAMLILHRLRVACESKFVFVVQESPSTSTRELDTAGVLSQRLPTKEKIESSFIEEINTFDGAGLPMTYRELPLTPVEYITLNELRLRVGDHLFKLMTNKEYSS